MKLKKIFLFITFILGYLSLSVELIVLRQLISFVGSNVLITSVIISTILGFMSLGYFKGSVLSISRYNIRQFFIRSFKMISLLIILSCSSSLLLFYFSLFDFIGIHAPFNQTVIFSLLFLSYPAFLFGKITALVGRFLHRTNRDYTGRFMAIDTVGSVIGSLITTLILMPFIGVNYTIIFIVLGSVIPLFILEKKAVVFAILILVIAIIFNVPTVLYKENHLVKNDAISTIEIYETDEKQDHSGYYSKIMMINGSYSSKASEKSELLFPYIKYIGDNILSHLPKDKPRKILVLGAGGFIIGQDDTFHEYTFLDIDPDLKDISEKYMLNAPLGPNKKFIAKDAYQYMLKNKQMYDVIILDIYSDRVSIPMQFVTAEFFNLIKKYLAPHGIMAANIITHPAFHNTFSKRLDGTLKHVFTHNLNRQVIGDYNPFTPGKDGLKNILYIYYNEPIDHHIYTVDKNTAFYDQ